MFIEYLVILAVLVIPLVLWARNASSPLKAVQDTPPLLDFTNSAFALRVTALIFGYAALFGLVTDYFFVAIGKILGALIATTVLFLILWGGARICGRRFHTPRRKAFELAIVMFAFFVVTVFIDLRLTQILG